MKYKELTDVRYLVVHCSATPPNMDVGVKEIDLWHRQRGFFSIGYHIVIRRDGSVEFGRPLDQPGAHAVGFNEVSRAVCLVGGVEKDDRNHDGKIDPSELVPENNFTREQFATLCDVLHAWKQEFPLAVVIGHRDLDSKHARLKACPSFDVRTWARPLGLSD